MKSRSTIVYQILSFVISIVLMCSVFSGVSFGENISWKCPNCGREGNTGTFCGNCGFSSPAPAPKSTPASETIKAGDIIRFGHYEQDNNSKNGKEEIEWIVLETDRKNNKALLLSKYGLYAKSYNSKNRSITWEKCTLRSWLNESFLLSAFSAKEQDAILTTKVLNGSSARYQPWDTKGGDNTKDKIFLLSYTEAKLYLGISTTTSSGIDARVSPTAYAIARGAETSDDYQTADKKAACWWWLRSPGYDQNRAARVDADGSLGSCSVDEGYCVVRPALWINLDSDVF